MKVKDKEKLNNPLKSRQILSAISSMVFHTVPWGFARKINLDTTVKKRIDNVKVNDGTVPRSQEPSSEKLRTVKDKMIAIKEGTNIKQNKLRARVDVRAEARVDICAYISD